MTNLWRYLRKELSLNSQVEARHNRIIENWKKIVKGNKKKKFRHKRQKEYFYDE